MRPRRSGFDLAVDAGVQPVEVLVRAVSRVSTAEVRCGARTRRSRSLSGDAVGDPVASSKPTLPVGPHVTAVSPRTVRTDLSARIAATSAADALGTSTRSSGATIWQTSPGATLHAWRCDLLLPRMPTAMSPSGDPALRTTTHGIACSACLVHAGASAGSESAAVSDSLSRSCGRGDVTLAV